MGGEMHTVQNLKVLKVDLENGIVVVNGAVPGPKYSVVKLQDAIKKPWPKVEAAVGLHEPTKRLSLREKPAVASA
jgi:large subunit ribosomal protein L3